MDPAQPYSLHNPVARREYALPEDVAIMFGVGHAGRESPKAFRGWEDLADWMHVMNLEAMKHRYGMEELLESAEFVDLDAKPIDMRSICLRPALSSFLYQCTEGDAIQDSALFQALSVIYGQLSYHVARDFEEYQNSRWG